MEIKTLSRLNRFREIVLTLLKYGFEDLVAWLDLPGVRTLKRPVKVDRETGTYQRICKALEDLGPTFIKFGQIMSLRPDLLPPPLVRELSRLQDEVAHDPFTVIKNVVEKNLGRPLEEVFTFFDVQPIAAASLSQVHRAVLRREGRVVAVKVQRPGIRRKVQSDLDILAAVAKRIHNRINDLRIYNLPNLVAVTRRTLLREMDFDREARHIKIARAYLGDEEDLIIPAVFEEYCTRDLLVTEFIQGVKLKEIAPGTLEDAERLARLGLGLAIKQILEHGFFHADPHPGNLLIVEGRKICLLDWGMVGRITREARYELIDLIHAVVERDSERLVSVIQLIADTGQELDRRALEVDLLEIIDLHFAVPLKDLRLGQLLLDFTHLLRGYRLALPSYLGIMIKALITAEGAARLIYPDLNAIAEAEPQVRALARRRFNRSALLRFLRTRLFQLVAVQERLPRLFMHIAEEIEKGQLSIGFEHRNLEGLRKTLEIIFDRLTFGIIIGSLIIGSSMIITTGVGPLLLGFPALGIIGYLLSAVVGLWIVYSILRSRK